MLSSNKFVRKLQLILYFTASVSIAHTFFVGSMASKFGLKVLGVFWMPYSVVMAAIVFFMSFAFLRKL